MGPQSVDLPVVMTWKSLGPGIRPRAPSRFRFSASRSRLDRFPISSSSALVIMPPRRAYGRNVNACNSNAVSPSPD
uniref:Uncharacterized protein n=1 Tax=Solanum tuberosum TaxID=4113 RepID=M1AKQ0_SOLTU